jgi:hypothetical protein
MNASRIFTAIILFALAATVTAQKREKQTIVLSGGSRLTGTILVDSSDYLKLRITSPQVITLKKSEVSLITPEKNIEKPVAGRHGYSIRISASVLAGRNSEGNTRSMSYQLSNCYRFRNGLSVGFGAGIEELDIDLLPVYSYLSYHPLQTRLSPFIWIKSGWSFAYGDQNEVPNYYYGSYPEAKGGFMFNAGTGIELASWRRNAVNIGVGYRYQKITFKRTNNQSQITTNEIITSFNRIEVQFGFTFM